MSAPGSFSDLIELVKLKSFTSTTTSLTEPNLLALLNDSYRSFVVPFLKTLRDEWNVAKADYVANTDANSMVTIPNSVASTMRTVAWKNNALLYPLSRVEPENAFGYQNATSVPQGFMLKGYQLVVLPIQTASYELHISYMRRPPTGMLEEDAGEIESHSGPALTLAEVPIAWQESMPATVDLISNNSPFSPVAEGVTVASLNSTTRVLTLSGIDSGLIEDGFWVSDPGSSPFPNIPFEIHPLLELDVVCTLFGTIAGDKRLKSAVDARKQLRDDLYRVMAPRTQGSIRPLVNRNAPGMQGFGWWSRYGGW